MTKVKISRKKFTRIQELSVVCQEAVKRANINQAYVSEALNAAEHLIEAIEAVTKRSKCNQSGCNRGWIHHQHPTKPLGVIMNSTPCASCNPKGKNHPGSDATFTVTYHEEDNK